MNDQKTILIDVNLTRGLAAILAAGLLALVVLGYLLFVHQRAAASSPEALAAGSAGMRQFYFTQNPHPGNNPQYWCAPGYHFASLWEINDPSNLKYNADLGYTRDDSVKGPPSLTPAWIRTGYDDGGSSSTAGIANCRNWTSSDSDDYGTYAYLVNNWNTGGEIGPWKFWTGRCCDSFPVTCVED